MKYNQKLLARLYNNFCTTYHYTESYRVYSAVSYYKKSMKSYLQNLDPDNPELWPGNIIDPYIMSIYIFYLFLESASRILNEQVSSFTSGKFQKDISNSNHEPQFLTPTTAISDIITKLETNLKQSSAENVLDDQELVSHDYDAEITGSDIFLDPPIL